MEGLLRKYTSTTKVWLPASRTLYAVPLWSTSLAVYGFSCRGRPSRGPGRDINHATILSACAPLILWRFRCGLFCQWVFLLIKIKMVTNYVFLVEPSKQPKFPTTIKILILQWRGNVIKVIFGMAHSITLNILEHGVHFVPVI